MDLLKARAETPGVSHVLHLNNAGAALMPRPVLDVTIGHLALEAQIGGYEAAAQADAAMERVYDAAARLIGARREEIALMESATRAWDMAFYAIPFRPGARILTSMAEYGSNYIAYLQVAQRTGARVEVIPNDESGQISVEALRQAMDDDVQLIALTHIPTNGGLVNPAAEVGKIAREAGVLYLLDACQSVGQMPVNVEEIGCDMLSATGRKYLRAPRGTGFLYVRQEVLERLEPPLLDNRAATWVARDRFEMRPDARRFETWEANVAGELGLGAAITYALDWGLDAIYARIRALANNLRARLAELPGVVVRDLGRERCGIVTFTLAGLGAPAIKERLAAQRINVSVSRVTSTRLDMEARGLTEVVRASVHYYNSEDELDRFCRAVASLM